MGVDFAAPCGLAVDLAVLSALTPLAAPEMSYARDFAVTLAEAGVDAGIMVNGLVLFDSGFHVSDRHVSDLAVADVHASVLAAWIHSVVAAVAVQAGPVRLHHR